MAKIEPYCKYCIIEKHKLFYLKMASGITHLVYQCDKKPTKIQKKGMIVYLPFIANLNLSIKKSKKLILQEFMNLQPTLF